MYDFELRNEYTKDLYREAEHERLVRSVRNKENSLMRNARKTLGRGLVTVGQHLLDQNQG